MDLVGYAEAYAAILAVYVAWAAWMRFDPRPPYAAAAGLILAGAAVGSWGDAGTGEVLGVFGFLTLLGAVAGSLLARRRPAAPVAPAAPPTEPVDDR